MPDYFHVDLVVGNQLLEVEWLVLSALGRVFSS